LWFIIRSEPDFLRAYIFFEGLYIRLGGSGFGYPQV
jgi:hypothetical protein